MKRMPRSSSSLRSLSSGSMTTKPDLSNVKWRSIKGSVPFPIEPKPIMTMGPSIRACTGHWVMIQKPPEILSGCIRRVLETEENAVPGRHGVHGVGLSSGCARSGASSSNAPDEVCEIRDQRGGASRADETTRAIECAGDKLAREQPALLIRAGQPQGAGLFGREAEAAVIGSVADQKHGPMSEPRYFLERATHQRGTNPAPAGIWMHGERA